jgi:transcriptional regulator with XRE-family HTH domain
MSTIGDRTVARLAKAVRGRRTKLGLSIRALAAKSGVSASMISEIERGAKSPTVSTLSAVAAALRVTLASLLDPPARMRARLVVHRAAVRPSAIDPETGARREPFGPSFADSKVDFLRYRVPARAIAGPFAPHAAGTIEHLYLASGTIRFRLGPETALLAAGDSCTCIADAAHSFDNRDGKVEAVLYLVVEAPLESGACYAARTSRPLGVAR